uniref:Ribonuclease A-domain domain-containing protein n=1 Tax=Pundamilia nyererei TaxID=303518 RepID=A0A3B4EXE7_9CICH
ELTWKSLIFFTLVPWLSFVVLFDVDERVNNFANQHIIDTEESCDKLIEDRKIKDVNGKDKKIRNTFIISTFNKVKDICKEEQRVYKNDNLYRSSEEMELLHCKLQYDKRKYEGVKIKKHIEIACVTIGRGLQPVHLQLGLGDISSF